MTDSFHRSQLGEFIRSPLGVRDRILVIEDILWRVAVVGFFNIAFNLPNHIDRLYEVLVDGDSNGFGETGHTLVNNGGNDWTFTISYKRSNQYTNVSRSIDFTHDFSTGAKLDLEIDFTPLVGEPGYQPSDSCPLSKMLVSIEKDFTPPYDDEIWLPTFPNRSRVDLECKLDQTTADFLK